MVGGVAGEKDWVQRGIERGNILDCTFLDLVKDITLGNGQKKNPVLREASRLHFYRSRQIATRDTADRPIKTDEEGLEPVLAPAPWI